METTLAVSAEDFKEYQDSYIGVCESCHALRDECEPDAENYECEECGEESVVGMEWALMKGVISISECSIA